MSEEIVLYHNPMSRGRTAHWMLEEVAEPYRIHILRFDQREHKKPEYLAINPMGKIPAIVHRGQVVTEAAAIVAYLADAFPQKKLAPALDDPARAPYLRWLFFAAACAEPAIVDHMLSRPKVVEASRIGYGSCEETLNVLEGAITPGPFILGDTFSAADVYVGSLVGWSLMTKSIEPRPSFRAYIARCAERPAFQRMATQNAEIAAKLKAESPA